MGEVPLVVVCNSAFQPCEALVLSFHPTSLEDAGGGPQGAPGIAGCASRVTSVPHICARVSALDEELNDGHTPWKPEDVNAPCEG